MTRTSAAIPTIATPLPSGGPTALHEQPLEELPLPFPASTPDDASIWALASTSLASL
jgi:hypothetical protein